jgi:hypothetical protein
VPLLALGISTPSLGGGDQVEHVQRCPRARHEL